MVQLNKGLLHSFQDEPVPEDMDMMDIEMEVEEPSAEPPLPQPPSQDDTSWVRNNDPHLLFIFLFFLLRQDIKFVLPCISCYICVLPCFHLCNLYYCSFDYLILFYNVSVTCHYHYYTDSEVVLKLNDKKLHFCHIFC